MLCFHSPPYLSHKSPGKQTPSMFPKTGPLWKHTSISRALLSIFFRVHPGSPHSAPFPVPSFIHHAKSLVNELPSRFPSGAPMKRDTHLQSLPVITFRVPCKGTPPPGTPHRAPTGRDTPFPELSFICLLKSLVNEPPSRFPSEAPMGRDAHLQSLPVHNFQGLQ